MSQRTLIFDNRFWSAVMKMIGQTYIKMSGWKIDFNGVPAKKIVIIAAPHTSNWDFPIFMAFVFTLGLRIRYLGKDSLFNIPLIGRLFYYLGGFPVERQSIKANAIIDTAVDLFDQHDELILGIAPEGTRSKVKRFKTGFYRIALQANVPIGFAYLDSKTKMVGMSQKTFIPTGDLDKDLAEIQAFYADKTGVKPTNQ
ncbi:1-acyl-sn-glycerol-3-phosphate acyltransferase [Temperatibacter marinus]|uniref:1-acyl-sn-glycerol-3-phosphate acyltransferase n=1 Tax=Temperatibacter marinus TaxID=1456591 RepID=A0AA52H8H0_9PROT|nr:1-acyl-sn-glycerol-3-phosphate acyltransferase [Temperatibacter marinus]WND02121.1 1-acyl-sn-glycerol-3-phosphate acyltransferase [Temperatibacter marinus]